MGRKEDLIEANRRGLLTGQIKVDFDEAVRKGLIVLDDQPVQEPTLGEQVAGGLQTAGTIASSIIAEPVAGLAGIGAQIGEATGLAEPGAAARTIEGTREALTFQGGEESQRQLQAIGETIAPVTEALSDTQKFLGESTFELTGSPAAAAIAEAAPAAIIEALGFKGLRASTVLKVKKLPTNAKKAVTEAAPSIDQLKTRANQLYTELDQSGVKVKPQVFDRFVESLESSVRKAGFDADLHPDSAAALRRLNKDKGTPKNFTELNTLRQIASDAAGSLKPKDARIGRMILNKIDQGIDSLADAAGKQSKSARQLWRRAKVSESIAGMIENAGLAASGLENGLRIEARKILKSVKKKRGFTRQELKLIDELEKGSGAANAAKFLGKFGVSEGKATSMLGAAIGGTIGNQLGGIPGALAALGLGQIAKKTAQRLTSGKAKFADQLVRAGGDAREITKAYLRNTPRAKQSVSELTELLLDPKVTPESISRLSLRLKIVEDAKFFTEAIKRKSQQTASAGVIASPIAINEQGL